MQGLKTSELLAAGSLGIYAAGLLTHNAYLATFGIYDLSFLQVKYVYIGSFVAFYYVLITFLFLNGQTADQVRSWATGLGFASNLSRGLAIAMLVFIVAFGPDHLLDSFSAKLSADTRRLLSILLSGLFVMTWLAWYQLRGTKIADYWQSVMLLPTGLLALSIASGNSAAKDILTFCLLIFIAIFLVTPAKVSSLSAQGSSSKKAGDTTISVEIGMPSGGRMDKVYGAIYFGISVVILTSTYANLLYPHIPRAWGGRPSNRSSRNCEWG